MGVSEDFERGTIEDPNCDYDGMFFRILGRVLPPSIGEDSDRVRAFLETVRRADFGGIADYFELKSVRTYSFLHPTTSALCFLKVDYTCFQDYHSAIKLQHGSLQKDVPFGKGIDSAVNEILGFMRRPDVKPVEAKKVEVEAPKQKALFFGLYNRQYLRIGSLAGLDLIE
jgi:hypothetical protein